MFVETAESGILQSRGDDTYELTLENPAPRVTYFSDRPQRDAGSLTVAEALDLLWDDGSPPPNAALTTALADGTRLTLALELTDPAYDADRQTLTFAAALLDGVTPGLADFELSAVDDFPVRFDAPDLFIDSSYHQCSLKVANELDLDLTRQTYSPTSSDRWGGKNPPPLTIASHADTSWSFAFQSDTSSKSGQATYIVDGIDVTVAMSWTCQWKTVGVQVHKVSCTAEGGDVLIYCDTNVNLVLGVTAGDTGTFKLHE